MTGIQPFRTIFDYGDRANEQIIAASCELSNDQLDQGFDMGRGTLRKTLIHILAGEHVWLLRWKGQADAPWLDEDAAMPVADIARDLRQTSVDRTAFLESIDDGDLNRTMRYLDTVAGYFTAILGDMIVQGLVHSIHHRAQAVNMLRRVGVEPPEIDYMTAVRTPESK